MLCALMPLLRKVLVNVSVCASLLVIVYALYCVEDGLASSASSSWHAQRSKARPDAGVLPTSNNALPQEHNGTALDVVVIFAKAGQNSHLKAKARLMVHSLLRHTSRKVHFHAITDEGSSTVIARIVTDARKEHGRHAQVSLYMIRDLAEKEKELIGVMQRHFSSQPGSYYSDALFFLSIGLFRTLPHLSTAILVDIDTKFLSDIHDLHSHFDRFTPEQVLGAAHELSPVYRHVLYAYRSQYPRSLAGEPAGRNGNPGLNSGVLLLQLERMRRSERYKSFLTSQGIGALAERFRFKGHLGDQDFYTLMALEWPEGVYVLPCGWNRQLCRWWEQHGYKDVFQEYFRCEGKVHLYHGNCNAFIPDE